MSRSNSPVTRGGGQAQDWQHGTERDPSAHPGETAQHQPYQWPQMAPQQAPYGYPQGGSYHTDYAAPAEPDPRHPPYHYPQDGGGHQPFSAPGQHPPFFAPQPAPPADPQPLDFGRYAGAHQHQQQAQHGQGAPYRHFEPVPEPQPYAAPFDQAAPYDQYGQKGLAQLQPTGQPRRAQPTLRDQLHAVQQDSWQKPQDPGDYDLGSYMPADAAGPSSYGAAPPGGQYDPHWQDPHGYGAHEGDPQAAGDYYAQYGDNTLPVAGQGEEFDDPEAEEGEEYEYEETGRGRRGLLIVGALVGAIVAGGGLAYAYKTILGPAPKSETPVIQADDRPAKSQPEDPGGKQFAHSDSKLMGRLEPDGASGANAVSASSVSSDDSDAGGVRRVPTIMVSRDGSIAPPPAEPRLPPATVSVPGMTIVDGFGGRPPMPPARNVEQVQAASASSAPRIIAKAPPAGSALAAPAPPPPAAETPPPPAMRTAAVEPVTPELAPERVAPVRQQPARQPAAAPAAKSSGGVGYVAVLASQKSRIDALKTFADLQQKYVDVLQNKIPDVQEADLSARGLGTMYRVVVGPPSSREAASDLCIQLRSAGFQGCWITAY